MASWKSPKYESKLAVSCIWWKHQCLISIQMKMLDWILWRKWYNFRLHSACSWHNHVASFFTLHSAEQLRINLPNNYYYYYHYHTQCQCKDLSVLYPLKSKCWASSKEAAHTISFVWFRWDHNQITFYQIQSGMQNTTSAFTIIIWWALWCAQHMLLAISSLFVYNWMQCFINKQERNWSN